MRQEERLNYLIDRLLDEREEYRGMAGSRRDGMGRPDVLRSLMNIRMPRPMDSEFLRIQDEYLREEKEKKGVIALKDIPTIREQFGSACSSDFGDKLSIWQGDITRLSVDAIVNAANSQMLGCFVPCHRCIDNAIHSAAGIELREECHHLMQKKRIQFGAEYQEPTGQAEMTKGYNLPAEYVIHTVGPIVRGRLNDGLREDLKNCYENVLKCAMEAGVRSLAFCCISTGEFHFPNDEAAAIAVETVTAVLKENGESFERIIFNVFRDLDREIYESLLGNGNR